MTDLYKEAGVNIDAGNETVKRIKKLVKDTYNPQVLGDIGSFGGLYAFPKDDFKAPVLVASTDGVGTKLKVAFAMEKYDTVGYDLVNHCVNDILVQGARPLFFLDYIGTGALEPDNAEAIVSGLARGCRENGAVLIGGETAEMPGIYSAGEFDLVGTIIGVVEREQLITGEEIRPGDAVMGLASLGLHTNGYSLARKICFDKLGLTPTSMVSGLSEPIGAELLKSHKSYFNEIYPLISQGLVRGLAHITGGGFYDNIPRILPDGCGVKINKGAWEVPALFKFLQQAGEVPDDQAYRVFNMGIGMVLICRSEAVAEIKRQIPKLYELGTVVAGEKKVELY